MYNPKHFKLYELVPENMYEEVDHNILWGIFDIYILRAIDALRDEYGPIWINNWWWGGDVQMAGLRPSDTGTGAKYSMHKFGRAMDLHFIEASVKDIREHIIGFNYLYPLIKRVELFTPWLHIDTFNTRVDCVVWFKD